MFKIIKPFENKMSRRQTVIGLVYLPIHAVLLSLLLPKVFESLGVENMDIMNMVYYGIGVLVCFVCFWSFLREGYDGLLDKLGFCLVSFMMALGLDYLLSYAVSMILAGFSSAEASADVDLSEIAIVSSGVIRAAGIFMVPIVEEVLFRGVVFGSLHKKGRLMAYAVTIALFAVAHTWQYVAASGDWGYWVYALQYIPFGIAACWLYERTNTIWLPIGFHMMINAMSFAVENMLANM